MSLSITNKKRVVYASTLLYLCLCCFKSGKGTDFTQIGNEIEENDPTEIISRALICFNDKYVYSSCEEDYRLNAQGNINVPHEYTDQYCEGPCLSETHLVLDCLDNIFENFEFYNKATIGDVKETVQAGCGYGSDRGNFNVAEHMQQVAENNGHDNKKAPANLIVSALVFFILGHAFLI